MKTYTVTLSGLEREDGEKPYDYAVLAYNAAGAVEQAMDAHMQGRRLQDEDHIWVERCRPGLHADGFFNDLRKEVG
jgi:hypothetical protein